MNENYFVTHEDKGDINISEEVITSIVKIAITEVDGVTGLSNTAGEIAELIGIKTVSKGVELKIEDNKVIVNVIITVAYGSVILEIAKKVQDAIIEAVNNAAGIENIQVNVHVSGLSLAK